MNDKKNPNPAPWAQALIAGLIEAERTYRAAQLGSELGRLRQQARERAAAIVGGAPAECDACPRFVESTIDFTFPVNVAPGARIADEKTMEKPFLIAWLQVGHQLPILLDGRPQLRPLAKGAADLDLLRVGGEDLLLQSVPAEMFGERFPVGHKLARPGQAIVVALQRRHVELDHPGLPMVVRVGGSVPA